MYKQKRPSRRAGKKRYYPNRKRGGGKSHTNDNGYGRGRIKTFDPRLIIGRETGSAPVVYEIRNKFSDFLLNKQLAKNISDHGFTLPTPIQDHAIPKIISGRDVVGVANTGTGKTAAFLIPLINKVCLNRNSRVLIITPTRELAVQIDKELQRFTQGLEIYSVTCIGGVPIRAQIRKLKRTPNFVIGTPGRLLDLENQGQLNFGVFDSIVLDEVDRMLDMGFINDINHIISRLPKERQSLFFSATLDPKVKSVMSKFIFNPVMISIRTSDTHENVYQDVIEMKGRKKDEILCELLGKKEVTKTLVFMRTKRSADVLYKHLSRIGFQTAVLHGNKSQNQRQRSLDKFGKGRVDILIATDVASRGIDVNDISHVINYDLPESKEAYIHRIGRTGRANKKGVALTFVA